jgi:hypothetical protein
MQQIQENNILYVCFTHIELQFEYPSLIQTIYMGEAQNNERLNLRDLAPYWEKYHPLLGATAGAFAMKNLLSDPKNENITHIGICQYRKFVSNQRIGIPALNYQVMDIIKQEDTSPMDLINYILPKKSNYLIGKPGLFNINNKNYGYLYQYKDVHFIEDMLRFTAIAVETGALDKNEVCDFFNEEIFLPGGIELGVMPKDFWIKHIKSLEEIVKRCVEEHDYKRTGFQSRSWAFCCERMGSFFLLREFRQQERLGINWMEDNIGQLNLINKEGSQDYKPGT